MNVHLVWKMFLQNDIALLISMCKPLSTDEKASSYMRQLILIKILTCIASSLAQYFLKILWVQTRVRYKWKTQVKTLLRSCHSKGLQIQTASQMVTVTWAGHYPIPRFAEDKTSLKIENDMLKRHLSSKIKLIEQPNKVRTNHSILTR